MGNSFLKMTSSNVHPKANHLSVSEFKFHDPFPEECMTSCNGLEFKGIYLPYEVVTLILSYLEPKDSLKASLVCRRWCNIIKSTRYWTLVYSRNYNKKPKQLPWYVYYSFFTSGYFDRNLIRNGNGEEGYKYWKIVKNYGDQFKIEDPPQGSDLLPIDVLEFNGHTSCFVTSYYESNKKQEISLNNNRLLQLIIKEHKPHIYVSEWVAGRFDCSCVYSLFCKICGVLSEDTNATETFLSSYDSDSNTEEAETLRTNLRIIHHKKKREIKINQWEGKAWTKVEMIIDDYPDGIINKIVFQHEGHDMQFWKGHYGSKMAGGVVKILFDSINP